MNGRRAIASSVAKPGCSDDQPSRPRPRQIRTTSFEVAAWQPTEHRLRHAPGEPRTRQPKSEINGTRQRPGPRLRTFATRTPVKFLERSRYAPGGIASSGSRLQGNLQRARPARCSELTPKGQPQERDQVDSLRPPSRIPCLGQCSRKQVRENGSFPRTIESRQSLSRYTQLLESQGRSQSRSPQTARPGSSQPAKENQGHGCPRDYERDRRFNGLIQSSSRLLELRCLDCRIASHASNSHRMP